MAEILIVYGSPARTSRTASVLGHVGARLAGEGHGVDLLHLRAIPAGPLLLADTHDPFVADAASRLARADAVVLGTPVYKAAYSGLLKVWLDSLSQFAFTDKIVLPLATGGSLANVLALDYALRPVLAAMGATHVVQGHFILDRLVGADPTQLPLLDDPTQAGLDIVIDGFLTAVSRPVGAYHAAVPNRS
jgi:FMN reductase